MLPSPPTPPGRGRRGAGCREGSSAPLSASRPQSNATPTTGSPLRGVSKRAQQGQSAGCSGQDLFTSNHESMQLRGDGKGDTSPAGQAAPWGLAPRVGSLGRECLTLTCGDPTYPLSASRREDTRGDLAQLESRCSAYGLGLDLGTAGRRECALARDKASGAWSPGGRQQLRVRG